jgi:hypothetical protein
MLHGRHIFWSAQKVWFTLELYKAAGEEKGERRWVAVTQKFLGVEMAAITFEPDRLHLGERSLQYGDDLI